MPSLTSIRRNRAFTLIELLVVILIIGILIAVAAPSFLGQVQKASNSAVQQQLATTRTELALIWTNNGQSYCPPSQTGTDPELDCSGLLVTQLKANEPHWNYISSAHGANLATVAGRIDVKLLSEDNTAGADGVEYTDANAAVAQVCEMSNSYAVFCFETNMLGQNVQLKANDTTSDNIADPGQPDDTATSTVELQGVACDELAATEAMTWDNSGFYNYIGPDNENSNNWNNAPTDCTPPTPTPPLSSYATAVVNGTNGAATPFLYWSLQADPTTTNGVAADSSGFGRDGLFAATVDSPPSPQITLSATGPFTGANGWALQNDGVSQYVGDSPPTGDNDDITDFASTGTTGPGISPGWTLEAWVEMKSSPAPTSGTETNILAVQNGAGDETIQLTADSGGTLGQMAITTTACTDGSIAGNNSSGPNSDGHAADGTPLCTDGVTPGPTTLIGTGTSPSGATPLSADSWHYVVVTRDPTTNSIDVYIDNALTDIIPDNGVNNASTDLSGGIVASDSVGDPTGINLSELAVYGASLGTDTTQTTCLVATHYDIAEGTTPPASCPS